MTDWAWRVVLLFVWLCLFVSFVMSEMCKSGMKWEWFVITTALFIASILLGVAQCADNGITIREGRVFVGPVVIYGMYIWSLRRTHGAR